MGWKSNLKFQVAVFARHLGQATAACLTAMSQGELGTVTVAHWLVALQTGTWAGILGVAMTFGRFRRFQMSRWGVATLAVVGTFMGDFLTHPTHFGGPLTEAAVTALGAGLLCLLVSFTPIGEAIDRLGRLDEFSTSKEIRDE